MIRELSGLRMAVQALVELKALELGVPNPLSADVVQQRSQARREPPEVEIVDVPTGAYVEAEARRERYEAEHGKAPIGLDFMRDTEDAAGDAAARGQRVTIYPEDREGFAGAASTGGIGQTSAGLRQALEDTE
jgi:hypothetical protein